MLVISRSALVPYSPDEMYRLVNGVEDYPQFLNWCVGARILECSGREMVAALRVRVAGIEKEFSTRNLLNEPHGIDLALVRGPFRKLLGQWSFQGLGTEGSKVALSLEFEFAGRVLDGAFRRGFSRVVERLVADFCTRAAQIYER